MILIENPGHLLENIHIIVIFSDLSKEGFRMEGTLEFDSFDLGANF